ncbi:MAG: hypothetical protein IKS17_05230 [Firmicutes bacterium]|nr:hypothetical protein [Bacillota bacterium]
MFDIFFEKVYSRPLENEPYFFAFPLKKGELTDINRIYITDADGSRMPIQAKPTALWEDGSIKWAFVRSAADLPANKSVLYRCGTDGEGSTPAQGFADGRTIKTDGLDIVLSTEKNKLFDRFLYRGIPVEISAPRLTTKDGSWEIQTDTWTTAESGPICHIAEGKGRIFTENRSADIKLTLTFYADKPWFELACNIINTTDESIDINALAVNIDIRADRFMTAASNYKTRYNESSSEPVYLEIDAKYLQYESNEHNPEVFYGTFFGDCTNADCGVCATVFQAQQNFPKAMEASKTGLKVMLVPDGKSIVLKSGMARQQKILVHLHPSDMDKQDINHRSTAYQMPARPTLSPDVFRRAGVFENIFTDKKIPEQEIFLTGKADEHGRCYGMLNWGDCPDGGYTLQGRGGGRLVWTNNEYDFPHACVLMYARTGIRRYMDYALVAARHQIDVDICHYSKDPLIMGGQYEHCEGHVDAKKVVCSHQWVEGLLDCWHLSGDREFFDAAVGIGHNVQRLLEQPIFQKSGQANARETGWALRTLCALYRETGDKQWLEKCDRIVGHFREWEEEYGLWLAPYTDNTAIRVVFMIAIAVCSLMRYYRLDPKSDVRGMMLRAVDDLVENARLDNGLFYYKELPSLKRLGNNPIILEALTYAYELTGDTEYLKVGMPTFEYIHGTAASILSGMNKREAEDALICGGSGTKGFAQVMVPFCVFYTAAAKEGLL